MSRFEVYPDNLRREPFRIYSTGSNLRKESDRITQVKGSLDHFDMTGIDDIKSSLEVISQTLNMQGNRVCDMADGLNNIVREYDNAETTILGHYGVEISPLFGAINWYSIFAHLDIPGIFDHLQHDVLPASVAVGSAVTAFGPIGIIPFLLKGLDMTDDEKAGFDMTFKAGDLKKFKDDDGNSIFGWAKKADDKVKDKTKSHRKEPGFTLVRDKNGNWKKVPYTDKKGTKEADESKAAKDLAKNPIPVDVKLAEKKFVDIDDALWKTPDIKVQEGIFEGSDAGIQLGRYTVDADAYLGPGAIGASAGASFTVLHAYADGKVGNDYLNAHGNVTLDVGRVGGEVEASAGIYDKNGNINPNLYVGAKAEAIAAEVSGSAGVNVMGVDASVKGSLNVGVGAHANVGIHDGQIAVDLGASLGVGASVSFTIDASGAVNAICEGAKSAFDGVTGFFGSLF